MSADPSTQLVVSEDNHVTNGCSHDTKLRRNYRFCSGSQWNNWPELELSEMCGTFSLQEFVQQRSRLKQDFDGCPCPEGQDTRCWLFENIRQFCIETNDLFVTMNNGICCNKDTCPHMTIGNEDIYFCSSHSELKECSAIDYARHTLDQSCHQLSNPELFPSRLNLSDNAYLELISIARKINRIIAHFKIVHSEQFNAFESNKNLALRFSRFIEEHKLNA
ncbi:hypothetical protein GJ496_002210 [Pomphorhynchus laevis]|nr:hypothetical protein GJ496_002210 [Pomphorhynchus laevis]